MTLLSHYQYKDTNDLWPTEIPKSWSFTPIKRLASMTYGDALPSDARNEDGAVPVYGSNGAFGRHSHANTLAPVILIGRKGSCGALNWSDVPAFAIDTVYFVDDDHAACNLRWLYWALHTANLGSLSQDTGVPGLSREIVYEIRLPQPPPTEQSAIADFLERETGKIDALLEEHRRLIELLKEKRQAVFSHAVTKGLNPDASFKDSGIEWLGEVPEHWTIRKLSSCITKITNGYVGPTRDILVPSGVPYIQATHIKGGRIKFDDGYFVTADWSNLHAKSILREDDVLIVQTGAGTGDVALVTLDEEGLNCHALIIVTADQSLLYGSYLSVYLQSTFGQQQLASIQTGAMHPHLNCGEVKFIHVPVPPLCEQRAIVAHVRASTDRFDALTAEAQRTVRLLLERRSALISAAVTGKIDVRESDRSEVVAA
ncbi:MAG: restriction endonuclease subunit S [Mesorhizobium sp.]|uniref:restriction endonuclease subunit S n=1 Tax=Mesorhizobium sp. TaxID=1871066 RepID=UPI000FE69DFE|nr:restriction endonuclease subunit S [Mesorhizobium sp.]RWP41582.1 MAG: restriction endonuclease subunit S [Mesorhizobium sp.]